MFDIGFEKLLLLAVVAAIVIGPERLPNLARQAAEMIKTMRDLAQGAREQLRDELGPEFADVDLRNLNPRVAVRRAILGDDDLRDLRALNPRQALRSAMFDEPRDDARGADRTMSTAADGAVSMAADGAVSMTKASATGTVKPVARAVAGARPRPRPRPTRDAATGYDDAT